MAFGVDQPANARQLAVCFFSHSPHLAGAERTLLELVTQLIEDYEARCGVVVPGDGPLIPRLEAAGAEVIRTEYQWWCSTEPVPAAEARMRIDDSIARVHQQVLPAVVRFDPDVICTQTIVIPYGAIVASELVKPHIWCLREYGERDGFRFFRPFDEVAGFILEHSDFLFGANRGLGPELIPGLRPGQYDDLCPKVHVPLQIGEPGAAVDFGGAVDFRVAEFATMAPTKRLDVAIRAIAELHGRGRLVGLVIAGPQVPAHVEYLNRLVDQSNLQNRILFLDTLDDIFPVMEAVDAVVISAPVHTFGRTAAESMFLGKPVVYPLGTGFDYYLEDEVTGLGYTAGDPHSMAERIDVLIQNRSLCREIGRRAQIAAQSLFTRDGFGGKFYRRALALRDESVSGCHNPED